MWKITFWQRPPTEVTDAARRNEPFQIIIIYQQMNLICLHCGASAIIMLEKSVQTHFFLSLQGKNKDFMFAI